jgi:transposase
MRAIVKHQKKVFMWDKVKELNRKGFNKSQIAIELGICRKTVRNYLKMDSKSFDVFLERSSNYSKKLDAYHLFIKDLLEKYPYLSASQIEDRLKENYVDFPRVNSKTIYNYIEFIRQKYGILKKKVKEPRSYEKLPESAYGAFAQVDFGQTYMLLENGTRKKVYFMAMVLCRSRQKHIYFQTNPFTSQSAIVAHQKAFEYFEGQPINIIYDQDRVFIVEENMGDLVLTQDFKSFATNSEFTTIFCRKSDPESKGKIENVVKYVKNNFCLGRVFTTLEQLNQSGLDWLNRTANAKVHQGTKKIPHQEWIIEKEHLKPANLDYVAKQKELPLYKVRKDNTIHYKSNFYTLPMGTYKNQDSWVYLEEKEGQIILFDKEKSILTSHFLSIEKGTTVRNTDHRRDKSQSLTALKNDLLVAFGNTEKAILYLDNFQKDKPRYVRDNFAHLLKTINLYATDLVSKTVDFCMESTIYNAYRFEEIIKFYHKEQTKNQDLKPLSLEINIKDTALVEDFIPKTSSIQNYNHLF